LIIEWDLRASSWRRITRGTKNPRRATREQRATGVPDPGCYRRPASRRTVRSPLASKWSNSLANRAFTRAWVLTTRSCYLQSRTAQMRSQCSPETAFGPDQRPNFWESGAGSRSVDSPEVIERSAEVITSSRSPVPLTESQRRLHDQQTFGLYVHRPIWMAFVRQQSYPTGGRFVPSVPFFLDRLVRSLALSSIC
jgi:hypothetical protein